MRCSDKRRFFLVLTFSTLVTALNYYAMLSGQVCTATVLLLSSQTVMRSEQGWLISLHCRQFFYSRFIDAAITVPLAVLALGLLVRVDSLTIIVTMAIAALSPVCLYMGTLSASSVKWVWFLFGASLLVALISSVTRSFWRAGGSARGKMEESSTDTWHCSNFVQ